MRTLLCYMPILQYKDLVAVIDSSQTVSDKDTGTILLFENALDILQQCRLRVRVKCGCLQSSCVSHRNSRN